MSSDLHGVSVAVVACVSAARLAWIVIGKLRQSRYQKRAVALPRSWADLCTVPEPYLMAGLTAWLWATRAAPLPPSATDLATALAGAGVALAGLALSLWSFACFPSVSTGHYVLPEQQVVTKGAYALVRHPIYLGVFLIWAAIALAFQSALALALLVLYVVPGYLVYMRSEEQMLLENLGEAYRRYRENVGGVLPRLRRREGERERT